jgi:hypothetical protein
MKTKTYVWHGGLLSMAAIIALGCGGAGTSTDPIGDPSSGAGSAAITSLGPAVADGCDLSMAFDITAAQPIGFVAVQNLAKTLNNASSSSSSDTNNVQLQLFAIDAENHQKQVNKQAVEADATLQTLLDQTSANSQFAQQHNSASNDTTAMYKQDATTSRTANATNDNTLKQTQDATQSHDHIEDHTTDVKNSARSINASKANADATNSATAGQEAAQKLFNTASAANSDLNKTSNDSLFNFMSSTPVPVGAVDPLAIINQMITNNAAQFSKQASNQSATTDNSASSKANQTVANTANQSNAALAAQQANSSAATTDHVEDHTASHLNNTLDATNSSNVSQTEGTTNSVVSDTASHTKAANDNTVNNTASARNLQTVDQTNHQEQSALVFSNLESLQSQHFVLAVRLKASQQQEALQVFQGKSNNVFASQTFPMSAPACGAVDP